MEVPLSAEVPAATDSWSRFRLIVTFNPLAFLLLGNKSSATFGEVPPKAQFQKPQRSELLHSCRSSIRRSIKRNMFKMRRLRAGGIANLQVMPCSAVRVKHADRHRDSLVNPPQSRRVALLDPIKGFRHQSFAPLVSPRLGCFPAGALLSLHWFRDFLGDSRFQVRELP